MTGGHYPPYRGHSQQPDYRSPQSRQHQQQQQYSGQPGTAATAEGICAWTYLLVYFPSVLWHCWPGDKKGIRPIKNWVLVCWWWRFAWSFGHLTAPVITTTSITLSSNNIQNGDILAPANPDPPAKWPLKWRKKIIYIAKSVALNILSVFISQMLSSWIRMRVGQWVGHLLGTWTAHLARWLQFCCCWSTALEHFANDFIPFSLGSRIIQMTVESSFVCRCWNGSILVITHIVSLSLHFNGHFPGEPGFAGVYWSKGWWRWWVVTTGLLEQ